MTFFSEDTGHNKTTNVTEDGKPQIIERFAALIKINDGRDYEINMKLHFLMSIVSYGVQ